MMEVGFAVWWLPASAIVIASFAVATVSAMLRLVVHYFHTNLQLLLLG